MELEHVRRGQVKSATCVGSIVAIMLIFCARPGKREKQNKMEKVEMKCFSHMNANAVPEGSQQQTLKVFFSLSLLRSLFLFFFGCDGNVFAAVVVAENVGNSWKQFFVVKSLKRASASRRSSQ